MPPNIFKVETRFDLSVIAEYHRGSCEKITPFGGGFTGEFCQSHRQLYSPVDAKNLCDWLNEREVIKAAALFRF